jgi:hypothetical protein
MRTVRARHVINGRWAWLKPDIAPIRLDPSTPRGYLFDRYRLIALHARAAANAGTPLDPAKPPKEMEATCVCRRRP